MNIINSFWMMNSAVYRILFLGWGDSGYEKKWGDSGYEKKGGIRGIHVRLRRNYRVPP